NEIETLNSATVIVLVMADDEPLRHALDFGGIAGQRFYGVRHDLLLNPRNRNWRRCSTCGAANASPHRHTQNRLRYDWALRSVQAQSPRHNEHCAELGRKPSNGEPANPRKMIIFACLCPHKRELSRCLLSAISGHSGQEMRCPLYPQKRTSPLSCRRRRWEASVVAGCDRGSSPIHRRRTAPRCQSSSDRRAPSTRQPHHSRSPVRKALIRCGRRSAFPWLFPRLQRMKHNKRASEVLRDQRVANCTTSTPTFSLT